MHALPSLDFFGDKEENNWSSCRCRFAEYHPCLLHLHHEKISLIQFLGKLGSSVASNRESNGPIVYGFLSEIKKKQNKQTKETNFKNQW